MFENSVYSVISPEGCAAILWKDATQRERAAEALKLTAQDLLRLKLIDEVIPEPLGGVHQDPDAAGREDVPVARQRFADCLNHLRLLDSSAVAFFPAVTLSLPLVPVGATLVPVFEESWLLGRRVGAVQGQGYALSALADAHRLSGDLDDALDAVRRAVDVFAELDDAAGLAHALNHLGCIERDRREFEPAEQHLREALRLREQLGDHRGENLCLANLGLLSAAAGDLAEVGL